MAHKGDNPLLTITTTKEPATDLGFLLHKHPDKLQTFDVSFGKAHVFYPEASDHRCTAALMLEVDPINLTPRGNKSGSTPQSLLQHYVNDRPYTASSHLSVAIAKVFGSALSGKCQARPELPVRPMPLTAAVTSVHSRYGSDLIHRLLDPLGYDVTCTTEPLDPDFPEWGDSPYHNVSISSDTHTLKELLTHLYVLLPALDNQKHYWLNKDEAEKLLRMGEGWLEQHPARNLITRRYLGHRQSLIDVAEEGFSNDDEEDEETDVDTVIPGEPRENQPQATTVKAETKALQESDLEKPVNLQQRRLDAVMAELKKSGARSVLDLGCGGQAQLLNRILQEDQFTSATGVEVSLTGYSRAQKQLSAKQSNPERTAKATVIHGSLVYRDPRLRGADAAVAMEVIEHIDPPRLSAFEDAVLATARPKTLIITTPNREYNVLFPNMDRPLRHRDHRFEWTRAEFQHWADKAAANHGYRVRYEGIGDEDGELGHPTQMAVFSLDREENPA